MPRSRGAQWVGLWVALCLLAPFAAAREMPQPATPAIGTAAGPPAIAFRSRDFERLDGLTATPQAGNRLHLAMRVRLLSQAAGDYGLGLSMRVWIDLDRDRQIDADELLLDDLRFASQAEGGLVTATATVSLGDRVYSENLTTRCVVRYGALAQPGGTYDYGDVVDQGPPVAVFGPELVPQVAPGPSMPVGPIEVVETAPGSAGGTMEFASPKGTAIDLTRTLVTVTAGDISLGTPRRRGWRTLRIPILAGSTQASTIRIQPVYHLLPRVAEGPLILQSNIYDQKVLVAVVGPPVVVTRVGDPAAVTAGPARTLATVRLVEIGPGEIRGPVVLVSPKGTAIDLTRTRVEVTGGNLQLGTPVKLGQRRLLIPVASTSSTGSTLEVTLVVDVAGNAPTRLEVTLRDGWWGEKVLLGLRTD